MGGVQSKKILKKLEPKEIEKITTLFNDISSLVKKNKIVDRDGFKRFHLIPGPLADRLFNLFDSKKSGMMTLDDFTQALAVCGKASEKDKVPLIFKFLDLDDDEIITKEEISVLSVVTLEGSSSPKIEAATFNGNGHGSPADEDPMLAQMVDMGFSKTKVVQALKVTENGTKGDGGSPIEVLTNWLLQNQSKEDEIDIDESPAAPVPTQRVQSEKPDPKTLDELTAGLAISTILGTFEALFATIDKEGTGKINVKQFKKWASSSKRPQELDTLLKPIIGLFDRALKWKQTSNSSSESLEKSSSFTSDDGVVPNPKELKRFSSLAVMESTPKGNNSKKEKEKEKELKKRESIGKIEKKDSQPEIVQTTTTTTTPTKKDDSESARSSTFDSDFSDTDDDQPSIKPAIQVVIREKPIEVPQLKSENSLLNIDTHGTLRQPEKSQTLRVRGTRASMKPAISDVHDIFSSFQPLTPANTSSTKLTSPPPAAPSQSNYSSASNSTTSSTLSMDNSSSLLPESAKSTQKPGLEEMKQSIQYLERGQFIEAKSYIDKCINEISNSVNGKNMKNEIIFCVGYRVAIGILEKIQALEQQLESETDADERSFYIEKMSLLSRFLVGIPLQSQHRLVCAKMAIKYNMEAKNYGIASKFLEQIQSSSTTSNKRAADQLTICRENKLVNESLPMYICAQCKSTTSLSDSNLTSCSCGKPIRLCFSTFELIKGLSHLYCSFCQSTYNIEQTEVIASSDCNVCSLGRIDVVQ